MSASDVRGHAFFPPDDVLRSWPDLYTAENVAMADKVIHAHFFVGSCDWWLAELDHSDLRLAFGYVNLGDPQMAEWGYFDLNELAQVVVLHPAGFRLTVERDLHWTPRAVSQVKEIRR